MSRAKMFVARVQRLQSKKPADSMLQKTADYFSERALDDTGMTAEGWVLQEWRPKEPYQDGEFLTITLDLFFARSGKKGAKGPAGKQFEKILAAIERAGSNTAKFGHQPWTSANPDSPLPGDVTESKPALEEDDPESLAYKMVEGGLPERVLSDEELQIPVGLIDSEDKEIENHPFFKGIYERGPHLRILLSAMNDALLTRFSEVDHILLYGPTGVAKTKVLRRIRTLVGEGAVLWINCPAATKAGLEYLFLSKYRNGCPRWVVLEEVDKSSMEVLNVLLPALDEERRITKHQYNKDDAVDFASQVIATCNNKRKLDNLQAGALANRFGLQLYCPRPNPKTMKRILLDIIEKKGGDPAWATKCVQLMKVFGTNDPRKVKAWLTGRERLTTGRFQRDLTDIHDLYQRDREIEAHVSNIEFDEEDLTEEELAEMSARPFIPNNGRIQ